MSVAALFATRPARRQRAYWVATTIVIGESIAGGTLDRARVAPLYPAMIHLGYPPDFAAGISDRCRRCRKFPQCGG